MEVLRHKFDVIADKMELALLKSAYSRIVKEGMDASSALFTTGGETMAQAASIPIHLGSVVPAVRRILHEFPTQTMAEEDVYIRNDPYDGGSHLPDIVIVVPILYQGRTVTPSTTMSHTTRRWAGRHPLACRLRRPTSSRRGYFCHCSSL